MPAMAIPQPETALPAIAADRRDHRSAWIFWIAATTVGAMLAAGIGGQMHTIRPSSASFQQLAAFASAVLYGLIVAGGQWLVLRRFKLELDWWVPATIAANVAVELIVLPAVITLAVNSGLVEATPFGGAALVLGTLSLLTTGLIVGPTQTLVLRAARGNIALWWIPATVVGQLITAGADYAIAPAIIDATLRLDLPVAVVIGAVAAVGGLALSICQTPVLLRLLR
jgi:hypothetical protein